MMYSTTGTARCCSQWNESVVGSRIVDMPIGLEPREEVDPVMVDQVAAPSQAGTILIGGDSAFDVVDRYLRHVAANSVRLVAR